MPDIKDFIDRYIDERYAMREGNKKVEIPPVLPPQTNILPESQNTNVLPEVNINAKKVPIDQKAVDLINTQRQQQITDEYNKEFGQNLTKKDGKLYNTGQPYSIGYSPEEIQRQTYAKNISNLINLPQEKLKNVENVIGQTAVEPIRKVDQAIYNVGKGKIGSGILDLLQGAVSGSMLPATVPLNAAGQSLKEVGLGKVAEVGEKAFQVPFDVADYLLKQNDKALQEVGINVPEIEKTLGLNPEQAQNFRKEVAGLLLLGKAGKEAKALKEKVTPTITNLIKERRNASEIKSAEQVPQPEVRTPMGEGTPLRQQNEGIAGTQESGQGVVSLRPQEVSKDPQSRFIVNNIERMVNDKIKKNEPIDDKTITSQINNVLNPVEQKRLGDLYTKALEHNKTIEVKNGKEKGQTLLTEAGQPPLNKEVKPIEPVPKPEVFTEQPEIVNKPVADKNATTTEQNTVVDNNRQAILDKLERDPNTSDKDLLTLIGRNRENLNLIKEVRGEKNTQTANDELVQLRDTWNKAEGNQKRLANVAIKRKVNELKQQGIKAEFDGTKIYLNDKPIQKVRETTPKAKVENIQFKPESEKNFEELPQDVRDRQEIVAETFVDKNDLPAGYGETALQKGIEDIKKDNGQEQSPEAKLVRDAAEKIIENGKKIVLPSEKGKKSPETFVTSDEIQRHVDEKIEERSKQTEELFYNEPKFAEPYKQGEPSQTVVKTKAGEQPFLSPEMAKGEVPINKELKTQKAKNEQGTPLFSQTQEVKGQENLFKESNFGKKNTLFTKDKASEIATELSGELWAVDNKNPMKLKDTIGVEKFQKALYLGGYYLEGGLREFADWSKEMTNTLGEKVKPHLQELWDNLKGMPETKKYFTQEGEQKIRGLAKSTEARAIANGVIKSVENLPTYDVKKNKPQIEATADLISTDLEKAKRIEFGQEKAPDNIERGFIHTGLEHYATMKGDSKLIKELATSPYLAEKATEAGQLIQSLRDQDPLSPVNAVKEIIKAREESFGFQRAGKVAETYEKRINELETKLKEKETQLQKIESEKSFRKIRYEVRKENRAYTKEQLKTERDNLYVDLYKELGTLNAGIPLSGRAVGILTQLMRNYAQEGITSAEGVIDSIYQTVKDKIEGITPEDIRHALTKFGQDTRKTKDELQVAVEDLRKQIDDIRSRYKEVQKVLGESISDNEIETITNLSKKVTEAKTKAENAPRRSGMEGATKEELEWGAYDWDFKEYIEKLKNKSNKITIEEIKHNPLGVMGKTLMKTLNASKELISAFDLSFIGRQGLKTLFTVDIPDMLTAIPRHAFNIGNKNIPRYIWGHTFMKNIEIAIKTFGGDNIMRAMHAEKVSDPLYLMMQKAKVALGTIEEAFPTSFAGIDKAVEWGTKQEGSIYKRIGRGVLASPLTTLKATENAFTGSAHYMRYKLAQRVLGIAEQTGVDLTDKFQLESIGRLVNDLTARGKIGGEDRRPGFVNAVIWSPKMIMGHINVLTSPFRYKEYSSFARKQAAYNLLKIIGGTATIMGIANAIRPGSAEYNPLSSDFGTIKIGDTRFDITGGMRSIVTLAARLSPLLIGQKPLTKNSRTGKITELNSKKYGSMNGLDLLEQFLLNKTSPVASEVLAHIKGETREGKEPTILGSIENMYTPFPYKTGKEVMDNPNSANDIATMILDAFGVSTNTYSDDPIIKRIQRSYRDGKISEEEYNKRLQQRYNEIK